MCSGRKIAKDFLVADVDAVKGTDGEPGVVKVDVVQGVIMFHYRSIIHVKSQKRGGNFASLPYFRGSVKRKGLA